MKRFFILIGVLLTLGPCSLAFWHLVRPPLTQVLVPGARDVQVVGTGVGEWQITYAAPGSAFAWYWDLARSLEAQQWTLRNRWSPSSSPTYNPLQPLHFDRRYGGVFCDVIVLAPDEREPNRARLKMRRRIALPWALVRP